MLTFANFLLKMCLTISNVACGLLVRLNFYFFKLFFNTELIFHLSPFSINDPLEQFEILLVFERVGLTNLAVVLFFTLFLLFGRQFGFSYKILIKLLMSLFFLKLLQVFILITLIKPFFQFLIVKGYDKVCLHQVYSFLQLVEVEQILQSWYFWIITKTFFLAIASFFLFKRGDSLLLAFKERVPFLGISLLHNGGFFW